MNQVPSPGTHESLAVGWPSKVTLVLCCGSVQRECRCGEGQIGAGTWLDAEAPWQPHPGVRNSQAGCEDGGMWWHLIAASASPPAFAGLLPATAGAEEVLTARWQGLAVLWGCPTEPSLPICVSNGTRTMASR